MKDSKELFDILLDQIEYNDADGRLVLADCQIDHVDIMAQSNEWHFYLKAPKRINPAVYEGFMLKIQEKFEDICKIEVCWEFEEDELNPQIILDYWQAILNVLASQKPVVQAFLKSASCQLNDDTLTLGLSSQVQIDTLMEHLNGTLEKRLQQVGINGIKIDYYVDEDLQNQQINQANERRERLDQESLLKALEAQAKREEMLEAREQNDSSEVKPIGKDIDPARPTIPIRDIEEVNSPTIVIEGHIFSIDIKDLRSGEILLLMQVTDYTSSVMVKLFSGYQVSKDSIKDLSVGEWVRMEGVMRYDDMYSGEPYYSPQSIRKITKPKRKDKAEGKKRIELHAHTQMSTLDATNSAADIIKQASEWGHEAVAITDKSGVQAFPQAYGAAKDNDIKVIYGVEVDLVNDGELVAYNLQDIDLKDATYVAFDVETTGLSSVYDKIIELAGVKMKEGEVIDTFEYFVNPHEPISAFITQLTSITDDMVADAPDIDEVIKEFYEFTKDTILVAHNASFDMGFINAAYEKVGLGECQLPVIDTLELSRTVNPHLGSHRLNTLARNYGIELTQHHRAIYDSETTGHLAFKLLDQAREMFNMTNHNQLNDQVGKGDSYKQAHPHSAVLLVKNQAGLKDLFYLVSQTNVEYFHRTPRLPYSLLEQYRSNLLVGTGDTKGEVFEAMMQQGYEEASKLIDKYDYIEIQPPSVYQALVDDGTIRSMDDVRHIIKELIRLGDEYGKIVVATGDVHYINERDAIYREVLIQSMKHNANRKVNLPPLHFRTTDEMLEEFSFLGEDKAYELVVENPHKISDMIEEVEVIKKDLYPPKIEGAEDEIRQMSYETAHQMYGEDLPELVEKRIEKELDSIIGNGFAVIYLISHKLVKKSNEDGYLVGSRGSVGSSLVATLTGITEVNPLPPHYYCTECKYSHFYTQGEIKSGYDLADKDCPECGTPLKKEGQDIPFETFLGFHGDKVPDIDLNFSGEYQPKAHAYTKVLFGEDKVYRAGTIGTVAQKTALGYVRGYQEHTETSMPQAERERLAYGIEGVKRTTGQHPGGIIVIPDYMDVYDFTPIQYPADALDSEWKTTHFDFHSIEDNVLKLDILGHDDPTMLRMLQDISGIDPTTVDITDEEMMKIFQGPEVLGVTKEQIQSETGTLGIPEFGTPFVRQMISETKPSTFAELLQISGLSHGTDVWLGNAQELIKNDVVPLSEVIGCRDDIMTTLMQYGLEDSLAFNIMEHVRKGRGIPDEWQEEMRKHNVPEWYIDSCLKIKYMFPKAHAAAYVINALRVAYFKVHYPIYYYCAYFSVRASDFDLVAMCQGKEMVKYRIEEINEKGFSATPTENSLLVELEIANEMLERGFKFKMVDLEKSDARNFIIEDGDTLIAPFRAIPGLGASVADQIVAAREEAPFLSKEDLQRRGKVSKTIIAYMSEHGILDDMPESNQLSLFDF